MTAGEPHVLDSATVHEDSAPIGEEPFPVPPPPVVRTVWWHRVGLIGAIVGFAAAGLAVVGSLLALVVIEIPLGRDDDAPLSLTFTGWGAYLDAEELPEPPGFVGAAPANGAPLVFAAVAVFAGAAVGLRAARRPAGAGYKRVAAVTAAIGAAFLAATVWAIGMQEIAWFENFRRFSDFVDPDQGVVVDLGTGFWLLLLALAGAIGATVCAALPASNVPPAMRYDHDPATPRYGVAVRVIRLPDAEQKPPDE